MCPLLVCSRLCGHRRSHFVGCSSLWMLLSLPSASLAWAKPHPLVRILQCSFAPIRPLERARHAEVVSSAIPELSLCGQRQARAGQEVAEGRRKERGPESIYRRDPYSRYRQTRQCRSPYQKCQRRCCAFPEERRWTALPSGKNPALPSRFPKESSRRAQLGPRKKTRGAKKAGAPKAARRMGRPPCPAVFQEAAKPALLSPLLSHRKQEQDLVERLRFFGSERQSERSQQIQRQSIFRPQDNANRLLKSVGWTTAMRISCGRR